MSATGYKYSKLRIERDELRAERDSLQREVERYRAGLIVAYRDSTAAAVAVARACDEVIDPSGGDPPGGPERTGRRRLRCLPWGVQSTAA